MMIVMVYEYYDLHCRCSVVFSLYLDWLNVKLWIMILYSFSRANLTFQTCQHLLNPWNDNKKVITSKDGQVDFCYFFILTILNRVSYPWNRVPVFLESRGPDLSPWKFYSRYVWDYNVLNGLLPCDESLNNNDNEVINVWCINLGIGAISWWPARQPLEPIDLCI